MEQLDNLMSLTDFAKTVGEEYKKVYPLTYEGKLLHPYIIKIDNRIYIKEEAIEVYLQYKEQKENPRPPTEEETKKEKTTIPNLPELKDYIKEVYIEDEPDWIVITKQIKDINKNYGLSCIQIKQIIKYAINYEDVIVDTNYGLGQFIPRYIKPTEIFNDNIRQSRKVEVTEDETVYINRKKYIPKEKEF